jgi:hypothetical protein
MAVQNSRTLGFFLGFLIFVFINIVQIGVNYAFSTGDLSYGFPYPFYEYLTLLSRGRIWGLGVIVDLISMLLIVVASGLLFPILFGYLNVGKTSITETTENSAKQ